MIRNFELSLLRDEAAAGLGLTASHACAVIDRLDRAERLLDLLQQSVCEDQECPNENTRDILAEVVEHLMKCGQ